MHKLVSLVVAILGMAVAPASATILTFDIFGAGNGTPIPQNYGDRVTAITDGVGSYGEGNGFTANVEVEYGFFDGNSESLTGHQYWFSGFDSLERVIYAGDTEIGGTAFYFIRFVADPGWLVRLNSFDIANYLSRAVETKLDVVSDLGGSFTDTFGVAGSSLTQSFTPMIVGNVVTLQIQGSYFNAGLDNINFDQIEDLGGSPIPEPSTALLLLGGLAVLCWRRRTA